jgi:hypothetical protein
MLSREQVMVIRAEIEKLELALQKCTDGSIRRVIETLIEEEKRKLVSGNNSK